ncbi:MAG: 30S ribosomal protein S16 [Chloroherpetonaceae bacterium]|nr:30S ribosomal protein S16 [Chloroherpetonaceae bacterium]
MVKIRLRKIGRKKLPIYQVVATDIRARRDGKFLEVLGRYEPKLRPQRVTLKEDRVVYWLGVGAQPTVTAQGVLRSTGLLYKMSLQRKGKSEEEIIAEMAKWTARQENRLKKKASRKSIRRKKKKAESSEKAAS